MDVSEEQVREAAHKFRCVPEEKGRILTELEYR
jgi:hypothetical protein